MIVNFSQTTFFSFKNKCSIFDTFIKVIRFVIYIHIRYIKNRIPKGFIMSTIQVIKEDYIKELINQYRIAIDMLGLAEILSIEEHKERIAWINEWEEKLYE